MEVYSDEERDLAEFIYNQKARMKDWEHLDSLVIRVKCAEARQIIQRLDGYRAALNPDRVELL